LFCCAEQRPRLSDQKTLNLLNSTGRQVLVVPLVCPPRCAMRTHPATCCLDCAVHRLLRADHASDAKLLRLVATPKRHVQTHVVRILVGGPIRVRIGEVNLHFDGNLSHRVFCGGVYIRRIELFLKLFRKGFGRNLLEKDFSEGIDKHFCLTCVLYLPVTFEACCDLICCDVVHLILLENGRSVRLAQCIAHAVPNLCRRNHRYF